MKRFKFGFLGIIIRNFLIFAVAIFGVIIVLALLTLVALFYKAEGKGMINNSDMRRMLNNEDYSGIKKMLQVDSKSWFYVVDDQGSLVYQSRPGEIPLSQDMLAYVPEGLDFTNISLQEYKGHSHDGYTTVTFESGESELENTRLIVDQSYKVIYSDTQNTLDQYTQEEFNLLIGHFNDQFNISKFEFSTGSGAYTALLLTDVKKSEAVEIGYEKIINYAFWIFIFMFLILILLFLISIQRQVKKPIVLLQEAILDFNLDENKTPIHYKGPKEFEGIVESFNELSVALKASQQSRLEAEHAKRQMLSEVSHDLKTPITIISGYADAIVDDKIDGLKRHEFLRSIQSKAKYLNDLVDKLSVYTALERPDFALDLKTADINDFSRSYLIDIYETLENYGFDLEVDLPEEVLMCSFDALQLKRIYDNIIFNTTKYNEEGTKIFFRISRKKRDLVISIGDDGLGISEALRGTIFNAFTMEDASRGGKGSGLGMAIVEKLVLAHGGTVDLRPVEDTWALGFDITLKLITSEDAAR